MSSYRTADFKNEEVKRCLMKFQLDLLKLFQSLSNRFMGQNSHVFIVASSFEKPQNWGHLLHLYFTAWKQTYPFNCREIVSWVTVKLSKQPYTIFVFWDLVWNVDQNYGFCFHVSSICIRTTRNTCSTCFFDSLQFPVANDGSFGALDPWEVKREAFTTLHT